MNDSGIGSPCSFCSFGLWSNSSSWLGPPAMNRKMTAFAFGAKCGGFGASGLTRRRRLRIALQQRAEGHRAEADAAVAEEVPAGVEQRLDSFMAASTR